MKIFLAVLASVVLLVALILASYFKLRITSAGDLRLRAGVGPFVFTVYPRRQKNILLSSTKYKKLMKGKKSHKTDASKKDMKTETTEKRSFFDIASFIREIVNHLGRYIGFFHTEIKRLAVTVGGVDAAEAALRYGAVSSSVYCAVELLDEKTKLDPSSYDNISVKCDFLSNRSDTECDINMKIRIFHIFLLAFKILILKDEFDSGIKQ